MLLHSAIRIFKQAKQYYLTMILTLAISLSMVLSVFSLVDLVFFAPLPYEDSENVYLLEGKIHLPAGEFDGTNPKFLMYIKKHNSIFTDVASYHRWTDYKLYDKTQRPELKVILASSNLFTLLGVEPELGRLFNKTEASGNKQASVILGYRVWQTQYQGNKNIVGQKIQLNQRRFTVIGVAPDNLVLPHYNNINNALWIPMDMDETYNPKTSKGIMGDLKGIARLKPSKDLLGYDEELIKLTTRGAELYLPKILKEFTVSTKAISIRKALQGDSTYIVIMLLFGVLLLMIIALINLTGMQLARAVAKIKTLAISFAFGASNKQILIDSFKHNMLVVSIAVILALLLTSIGFTAIEVLATDSIQRLDTLSISFNTLVFSFFIAALIALIYSYVELKVVNEKNLTTSLQSSGKGVGKQMSAGTSHLLIGLQIAFSFVVLVAACHVVFLTLSEALRDNGLDTKDKWSLTINYSQIKKKSERNNIHKSLTAQLAQLSSVKRIELSSEPRLPEGLNLQQVYDENNQYIAQTRKIAISSGYLQDLNLNIRGELFKPGDSELKNYPVIVNQRLADKIANNTFDVINKKISIDGKIFHPVIGVVANTYVPGEVESERFEVYTPQSYAGRRMSSFLITSDNNDELEPHIVDMVKKVDTRLDVANLITLKDQFNHKRKRHMAAAWISILLASVSLVMVCIGVNGIVNYMVNVRRYDLGVKLAMGACHKRLLKEGLTELMKPIAMSIFFSFSLIFMSIGYSKTLPDLNVNPEWFLIAAILISFCILSLLVSYFPIQKILAKDPIKALRNE
ncbi:ABC transporter permease [Pseudoalteromonas denitrificans]|uniref:Duplicated orphan permease n=1 Tax=Pseudoalteromonas denitrificans DSM 6059 TaxID=1123010 RepID=A0A1I1JJV6_9GAMM|nr:ABC transporter permease [Pseudoalteromonas denitrificans]SFC48451.1 duplicated orphan permease [Pseudoalteromonas denitrificans DSM 6059]